MSIANGTIELICGCMFSGKTTALIQRMAELAQCCTVTCAKPAIDNRYSDSDIVTHDGAALPAVVVQDVKQLLAVVHPVEVVGIDEIHFFDDTIVEACRQMAVAGKTVVCCGLDHDMWGDPFDHVLAIREIAQTTIKFGVCQVCGQPADRTHRKTPLIGHDIVGGPEAFEPRCQRCFKAPDATKPISKPPGLARKPGSHT